MASHSVIYLLPYSPNYNPIELTFSVLKAWVRRHFYARRSHFINFGNFLKWCINESRCDRFALEHFGHAGGGGLYIDKSTLASAREYVRAYEQAESPAQFYRQRGSKAELGV